MLCLSILYGKHVRKVASMQLKTWNTVLSNCLSRGGERRVLQGTNTQPPGDAKFNSIL